MIVTKTFWAGFVNGNLGQQRVDDGFGGSNARIAPALFYTRREARTQYDDVRKVLVVYPKGKR